MNKFLLPAGATLTIQGPMMVELSSVTVTGQYNTIAGVAPVQQVTGHYDTVTGVAPVQQVTGHYDTVSGVAPVQQVTGQYRENFQGFAPVPPPVYQHGDPAVAAMAGYLEAKTRDMEKKEYMKKAEALMEKISTEGVDSPSALAAKNPDSDESLAR